MRRAQFESGAPLLTAVLILLAIAVPVTAARMTTAAAYAHLARTATIPGTAWWTDPATGSVLVSADSTVTGANLARLSESARATGATLIREPGTLRRHIAGADLFFSGVGGRCNVGFNARALPDYYFITSAHCVGAVASTVYADGAHSVVLGVVVAVTPTYDHAIVRYTNLKISKPSSVNLHSGLFQTITSVSAGYVGQSVKRSGAATGVHSGTITALNATVNYADATVLGLIRTNVCAEAGDSGGPLFAGTVAIGVASGGSGNCTSGGTTYFASAQRAMTSYGVTVY